MAGRIDSFGTYLNTLTDTVKTAGASVALEFLRQMESTPPEAAKTAEAEKTAENAAAGRNVPAGNTSAEKNPAEVAPATRVLGLLLEHGPQALAQLGKSTGLNVDVLLGVLDQLKKYNLVSVDGNDQQTATLTKSGEQLAQNGR